jgi:hypothetical protein
MHVSFDLTRILVGVAGEAKLVWRRGDELDVGYVFVGPDFVTARASHRDGGVHGLAFGFVFVTLEASRGVGFWVERDGMHGAEKLGSAEQSHTQDKENPTCPV